ncbi:MAG: OadG family protein [Candidatus Dadabacteria bacterium]|nr:OadG family protein [Candidatus Dadabacteria bacterium]MCY4043370.1 OadG family protein [Candidatus Dadabacteria bacterium]MCY4046845.1 OadG family protein [Candidatus Dadabacteria bacterium]
MIVEGLKLMLAGMFVVYVFLAALLLMIKISERFFGGEESPAPQPPSGADTGRVAAVISAAVSLHMSQKG